MRETRALRRAAWRELWPAALLVLGCAVAIAQSSATATRPATMWIGLWLVPAGLLCGTAVGRSTPRMLAFLLARSFRRERVLAARLVVSLGMLGAAWAIVASAVAWADPHPAVVLDAVVVAGVLVLAVICGALGSTVTDREPLALGIGTLVFSSMACVPLVGAEALDVTYARVIAAGPTFVLLALLLGILGMGRAVLHMWRDGLPLRDGRTIRALVTRCAGAWAVAETIAIAQVWRSASPDAALPMIVVGVDERGLVLASGSPQSLDDGLRLDAIHIGTDDPVVAHHAPGSRISEVVMADGRIVVEVTTSGDKPWCAVLIVDLDGGFRPVEAACGRMWLSPSGRSVAITNEGELAVVDLESATVLMRTGEFRREREVLGWSGETPLSRDRAGRVRGPSYAVYLGDERVATFYAWGMEASPDALRLAYVVDVPSRFTTKPGVPTGRIEVRSVADGRGRVLVGPRVAADVIGWLDAEHVATIGHAPDDVDAMVSIIAATTAEVVVAVPRTGVMPVTGIDGPVLGPWIVNRGGAVLEAWNADGSVLWSEGVATFERDEPDARRWAIVDREIFGIDPRGRLWRHPLPWEVTP
jgi:hypothetical protein